MTKKTVKNPHILIVEDDSALNDAFQLVLKNDGFTVTSAYNGQEALDALSTVTPDLIILDLLMPIMDGREFLHAFNNHRHIPIIVLSNLDAKSEIQEIMSLGASRYVLKAWASPRELIKLAYETISERQGK